MEINTFGRIELALHGEVEKASGISQLLIFMCLVILSILFRVLSHGQGTMLQMSKTVFMSTSKSLQMQPSTSESETLLCSQKVPCLVSEQCENVKMYVDKYV